MDTATRSLADVFEEVADLAAAPPWASGQTCIALQMMEVGGYEAQDELRHMFGAGAYAPLHVIYDWFDSQIAPDGDETVAWANSVALLRQRASELREAGL